MSCGTGRPAQTTRLEYQQEVITVSARFCFFFFLTCCPCCLCVFHVLWDLWFLFFMMWNEKFFYRCHREIWVTVVGVNRVVLFCSYCCSSSFNYWNVAPFNCAISFLRCCVELSDYLLSIHLQGTAVCIFHPCKSTVLSGIAVCLWF